MTTDFTFKTPAQFVDGDVIYSPEEPHRRMYWVVGEPTLEPDNGVRDEYRVDVMDPSGSFVRILPAAVSYPTTPRRAVAR